VLQCCERSEWTLGEKYCGVLTWKGVATETAGACRACIVYIYLRKEHSDYIVEATREGGHVVVASSLGIAVLEFPKF
jgi:hypothetical protein